MTSALATDENESAPTEEHQRSGERPRVGPPKPDPEQRARERAEDAKLVEAIKGGDKNAFRKLFERYNRRAFAVALGVLKNPQDARDVVQDAFIKVHKHIHNFQGSSSFYTWLYRIVMNLSIDHIRRSKKRRNVDYDDQVLRGAEEVAGDGTILPRVLGDNPAKTVLRDELAAKISKALETLPEYHRAVLILREVEGLSYEEMSDILKVPKGTIMSRLYHARRKMHEELGEYVQGELHIKD